MAAPVYKIGTQFFRHCYDGWIYELPRSNAHNYEGREIGPLARNDILKAIADRSAVEVTE